MREDVEEILANPNCTPAQREILAGHLDEIQRLARIVDNLSLLTKADAGLIALEHENVRIDELVREAFDDACVLGAELDLRVELGACEPVTVRGDRNRLRQVLLNLIDNAVKYNERGGLITLGLGRETNQAVIVVSNTGPGVDPSQLGHVFERFFRGETARRIGADGPGLGLAIARWIVDAHGGRIGLSSERGGKTVATVTVPVAADASPEALLHLSRGFADGARQHLSD